MNNKGQTLGVAIIVAVMIFMVGMISLNFIKDQIDLTRNSDNMDCSNSAISDGAKLTCLAIDFTIPYVIITVLSISGGIITSRFIR